MGLIRKLEGIELHQFLNCIDRAVDASGDNSERAQQRHAENLVEYVQRVELCKEVSRGDSFHYGKCTLYLTTKRVVWKYLLESESLNSAEIYLELLYPVVLMHAVCRDMSSYAYPCLYLQLDEDESGEEDETEAPNCSFDNETCELEDLYELRFAPENEDNLQKLFEDFCFCASLHPDADDDFVPLSLEEEKHQAMSEDMVLAHLDNVLTLSDDLQDGRFDDAEESYSESDGTSIQEPREPPPS